MPHHDFKRYFPEDLRAYQSRTDEADYVLVDVRQPAEYQAGHIPGALLIPLGEVERRLFELPPDRDLVFYCRSGGRSAAAASLAVDAEVTEKSVAHLEGGILGWDGHTLAGTPRRDLFTPQAPLADLLKTAMDLEKGAWRFYTEVIRRYPAAPFTPVFTDLSAAEIGHARMIYHFWQQAAAGAPAFDAVYDSLGGDILEGGVDISEAITVLAALEEPPCMGIVEWAIGLEHRAYDLYRNSAETCADAKAKAAFLSIAQAEKSHMKLLIKAADACP